MTRTYECMFLIDNDAVRAGWQAAKTVVSGLVEKHGGGVQTARRWDERRLAYPIRHRNRATYLLAFCDLDPAQIDDLRRDLDINETVLRYLFLSVDAVPDEERELSAAEQSDDFVVPEPPADDAPDPEEVEESEEEAKAKSEGAEGEEKKDEKAPEGEASGSSEGEAKEGETKKEAEGEETKASPEPVTAEPAAKSGEEA